MDHLLVEFPDPRTFGPEMHPVQATIGNRPAGEQCDRGGTTPRFESIVLTIPDQAWPELREIGRWVAPREHVEHRVEKIAREIPEIRGAGDRLGQRLDLPRIHRRHRHDLLGEHIEGIARNAKGLHFAAAHARCNDRGLEQIAAMFGEHSSLARNTDLVARAANPLEAPRYRTWRL
ncbi:MAG: hypothetical protein JRG95_22530, partial [Deltaproteobacteria bacterium]|nr:hypothetical protein [Deltaproteobacteria bacterium]